MDCQVAAVQNDSEDRSSSPPSSSILERLYSILNRFRMVVVRSILQSPSLIQLGKSDRKTLFPLEIFSMTTPPYSDKRGGNWNCLILGEIASTTANSPNQKFIRNVPVHPLKIILFFSFIYRPVWPEQRWRRPAKLRLDDRSLAGRSALATFRVQEVRGVRC